MTSGQGITMSSWEGSHGPLQPNCQFLWSFWKASATHNRGVLQVTVTSSINQVASDLLGNLSWADIHSACLQTSGAHDSLHPWVCNGVWIQQKTYKSQKGQEDVRGLDLSSWLCSDWYRRSWELIIFLAQQQSVHASSQDFPSASSPVGAQAQKMHT